jgi:antitoxin CptB
LLASVIQIEKFAPDHRANDGELLDHHSGWPRQISGEGAGKVSRQTEDVGSFRPLRDAERALYQRPDRDKRGGRPAPRQASRAGYPSKRYMMQDDLETRRRRAAYRAAHRGTKEMDIVLGRYAEARLAAMSPTELAVFERFLALPDPLLNQWFTQGLVADAGEFAGLIDGLRAHHGLSQLVADEGFEAK